MIQLDNGTWDFCMNRKSLSNFHFLLVKYKLTKEKRAIILKEFAEQFEIDYNQGSLLHNAYRTYKRFLNSLVWSIDDFLNKNEDATEQDYYKTELQDIKEHTISDSNPNVFYGELCLNNILPASLLKKIMYSQKRKIEFLEKLIDNNTNTEIEEFEPKNTAIIKTVILHELGIIDYLGKINKFGLSQTRLAMIIAQFTNDKPSTIQKYLNAMDNNDLVQTPLKPDNITIAHEKLINIGLTNENFKTKPPY